ncbi:MAG: hypothetical protein HOA14_15280 [Planctomycetaceae bacterium]|nr:hypothetical protein [Planctomycetaceae bacterium]
MKQTTSVLLFLLFILPASTSAKEPPPRTSLSQGKDGWMKSTRAYAVLKRQGVEMTVVTNQAVDDEQLPDHRAGYSGIAQLRHSHRQSNLFVPNYAGINYEHIHDGTTQSRDVLFEPRRAPMELRLINKHCVDLYQPPTPHFQLESCLRYELLPAGIIQMTLECIARKDTFSNGYIGLFWASYIHQPESLDIHFPGWPNIGDRIKETQLPPPTMIRGVTSEHGLKATHRSLQDRRQLEHDKDFPLSLVFGHSDHRYSDPWYYGVSNGMGFAQIFRRSDNIRITQSPSGGGQGNPAWDFQFIVDNYQVGKRYQMVMRIVYQPIEPRTKFLETVRSHYQALQTLK